MSSVTFRRYKTSAEWCVSSNNVNVFLFTRLPVAHSCNTHCIVLRSAVVLITFWQVLKILHQSDSTPHPNPPPAAHSHSHENSIQTELTSWKKMWKWMPNFHHGYSRKRGEKQENDGIHRSIVCGLCRDRFNVNVIFSFCPFERGCHSGHSSGWCADINTTVKQRPWE